MGWTDVFSAPRPHQQEQSHCHQDGTATHACQAQEMERPSPSPFYQEHLLGWGWGWGVGQLGRNSRLSKAPRAKNPAMWRFHRQTVTETNVKTVLTTPAPMVA